MDSLKPVWTEPALQSLQNIRDYTRENWGSATLGRLKTSIDRSVRLLASNPRSGVAVGSPEWGVRRWVIHPQKLLLYYRIEEQQLVILNIFHGAQDPENRGLLDAGEE